MYNRYTQPMAEFYFYYNRYMENQQSIQITFNPYITPGYPALVVDQSPLKHHLTAYVVAVTQDITASSISTSVDLQFIRRSDDEAIIELQHTTTPTVEGFYPATVQELLKGRIPFFEGEYSQDIDPSTKDFVISAMYKKTLGCDMWRFLDQTIVEAQDISEVNDRIKREIQCCQVTGEFNDPDVEASLAAAYNSCPSLVSFDWNDGDWPEKIIVGNADKKQILWNDQVQQMVKWHSDIIRGRGSLNG